MAGILANSVSKTMVSGDTSATDIETGYVTGEKITLTTSPTGTDYEWELSIPSGSAAARSALSDTDVASPTFTPDVAGEYVVRVTVDSATEYTCRLTVVAVTISVSTGGHRFLPVTNASVPSPSVGQSLYYSSDEGGLVTKDSAGTVAPIAKRLQFGHARNTAAPELDATNTAFFLWPADGTDNPVRIEFTGLTVGNYLHVTAHAHMSVGSNVDPFSISVTVIPGVLVGGSHYYAADAAAEDTATVDTANNISDLNLAAHCEGMIEITNATTTVVLFGLVSGGQVETDIEYGGVTLFAQELDAVSVTGSGMTLTPQEPSPPVFG